MTNNKLTTELFCFPYHDKFIVYSPLKQTIILTNNAALNLLYKIEKGELDTINEHTKRVVELLQDIGFINGIPDVIPTHRPHPNYLGTDIDIIPRSDCNLRCVYCYANAGENIKNMKWDVVKAAIQLVVKNAIMKNLVKKNTTFCVNFLGGGEPTLAWDVLTKSVEYARNLSDQHGLRCLIKMTSNFFLNKKRVEWIGKNFNFLNVSFDGPRDIQDLQRPTKSGKGSFDVVFSALKQFENFDVPYQIRSTITNIGVNRMPEIVEFFCSNFKKLTAIEMEPLFSCGRCLSTGWAMPDPSLFKKGLEEAQDIGYLFGVSVYSGLADLKVVSYHCEGMIGIDCFVTPGGYISFCPEVFLIDDYRSNYFFYGRYNKKKLKFEFDIQKIKEKCSVTSNDLPYCSKCIGKWHCAGGCPVKIKMHPKYGIQNPTGISVCELTQELIKGHISKIVNGGNIINLDTKIVFEQNDMSKKIPIEANHIQLKTPPDYSLCSLKQEIEHCQIENSKIFRIITFNHENSLKIKPNTASNSPPSSPS